MTNIIQFDTKPTHKLPKINGKSAINEALLLHGLRPKNLEPDVKESNQQFVSISIKHTLSELARPDLEAIFISDLLAEFRQMYKSGDLENYFKNK